MQTIAMIIKSIVITIAVAVFLTVVMSLGALGFTLFVVVSLGTFCYKLSQFLNRVGKKNKNMKGV